GGTRPGRRRGGPAAGPGPSEARGEIRADPQGALRGDAEMDRPPEATRGRSRRRRPHQAIMNRGDVVELDWPFSDRTGSKTRPAVVVQADFLNGLIDDTILVQVTGTRHGLPGTEVEIDPSVETVSGL